MITNVYNIFFQQMLEIYKKISFIDNTGKSNLKTVVEYTTELLIVNGYKSVNKIQTVLGITIYPTDYFCPLPCGTLQVIITKNTRTIHHYSGTWVPWWVKLKTALLKCIKRIIPEDVLNKIRGR